MEVLVIGIKEMQINEEITDKEVRLISNDGEQLGIVSVSYTHLTLPTILLV